MLVKNIEGVGEIKDCNYKYLEVVIKNNFWTCFNYTLSLLDTWLVHLLEGQALLTSPNLNLQKVQKDKIRVETVQFSKIIGGSEQHKLAW